MRTIWREHPDLLIERIMLEIEVLRLIFDGRDEDQAKALDPDLMKGLDGLLEMIALQADEAYSAVLPFMRDHIAKRNAASTTGAPIQAQLGNKNPDYERGLAAGRRAIIDRLIEVGAVRLASRVRNIIAKGE